MKYIVKMIGLFSLIVLLGACQGERTFDTSSEDAMQASAKAMAADLPEAKKKKFKESIAGIYVIGSLKGTMEGKDDKAVLEAINRQIDGLTVDEIIALAEKIEDEIKDR